MAFPSNPSNGATYVSNGVTYTFNSSTSQWIGALPTTGGGSMGAPTHFARFFLSTYLNSADHLGGQAFGYDNGLLLDKVIDLSVKAAAQNGNVTFAADAANYGTAIIGGGTLQDFSASPQFCSDEAYLASNPTFVSYSGPNGAAVSGNYYCADTGLVRFTNDSGVTFISYTPQTMSNGKIKLVTPGKYKVKIRHWSEISGLNSGSFAKVHTVLIMGGAIKINYIDRTKGILETEFDSIIEATEADTEFSLGVSKLNVNFSNHTFAVTVESLF